MRSFYPDQLSSGVAPMLVWLLNDVTEIQVRLSVTDKRDPVLLETLRKVAFAQSIESSNRIEGIEVHHLVLDALVQQKRRPQDRSEEEIAGYCNALKWIHEEHQNIELTPGTLLKLHKIALSGSGHAGQFKKIRSDIYVFEAGQQPKLRFATMAPEEVSEGVDELCGLYHHVVAQRMTLPLLAAGRFVLDFLSIHPFTDGNGRVSRLVWLLLLYHQGHAVGRYISLERIVEQHKEGYYEALQRSSVDWHEGRHDTVPWVSYFLTTIKRAYHELDGHLFSVSKLKLTKSERIELIVDELPSVFSKADIVTRAPDVGGVTIRNTLRKLKDEGAIEQRGKGRGTKWVKSKGPK